MSAPFSFKHEMLVANAGSGKTYALTTRIIKLMIAGVPINRIAALTFTRKSAGEFLDELLIRLAEAASDPNELKALADATESPDLSTEDCCRLLRHIIEHFDQLGLGTIDSFFARIARQFPLESGLPEEFAVADTASLASARERALAASFARCTSDSESLEAMIDQCRQISRRQGERNIFGTLLNQIETLHQSYLQTPANCVWGEASAIWPTGDMPFGGSIDLAKAIDDFESIALATEPEISEEAANYLKTNLDALRSLEPGQAWSKDVQTFVERKLSNEPKKNQLQLTRKKTGWLELTDAVRQSRKTLLNALYGDLLQQSLERAQGLHAFVRQYESVYSDLIRGAGLISFSDITTLLAERADDASNLEALDWRTQVAYRIDQRFDHWLLDEFQDTSRVQWAILRTFIEEVLMDDAAQRSFFYVGDTKQAIYGWRGGDSELFREIFDYYESIQEAPALTKSWRSTEPVIEMVNTVFGDMPAHAEALKLPEDTVNKWQLGWNTHEVANPLQGRTGWAHWLAVEKDKENESNEQHEAVLSIIKEVDPIGRNIECAVLLRKNKDAADLAAFLQSQGVPVAVEGKSNPCTDNFLGQAVLAALCAAAHPDDTLAAAIARGLPCAKAWGLDDMQRFRESTLLSIAEQGFAKTLQTWLQAAELCEEESFLKSRGEVLLAAAEAFDAKSAAGEGIDAFIAAIEAMEYQEAEASAAIRIMTVHQSKGLGFDMVITCGLDQSGRTSTSDELVLGPDKNAPSWGLLMPRKDVAEQDPLLQSLNEQIIAEANTNELCSAYVALTRAKRALYVISDALDEKSRASHFGRHLKLALEEGWEAGQRDWYERI